MVRTSIRAAVVAAAMTAAGGAAGQQSPPDMGSRAYLSANGLLNRGMYELAADEYRRFLAESPSHEKAPVARYGLAVCLVRLTDYEGAGAELAKLRGLKGFEFGAEVGLLSAQCDMAGQKYADAAREAERTGRDYPESPVADDAAGILAEARYREKDYGGARQAAEMLAAKWPKSPARARAELIWGLSAAAMGDDRAAAERLTALAAAGPGNEIAGQATLAAAQARHRLGEAAAARGLYEKVLAQPKSELTSRALLGLGTLLHASGDISGAGKALDRVIDEFSTSDSAPAAGMERGRVWLDAGDVDRARACFAGAVKRGGVAGDEAAFWLARCELRAGDADAAAARLGKAIDEFPESGLGAELRFDRAAALVRAGDDKAASAALADFERRFPGHRLMPGVLEMHAGTEHRMGEYAASLALCERYLRLGAAAHEADVEFLAGENELLAGNLDAAAARYAALLNEGAEGDLGQRCAFRLGTVFYRLGKADDAEPLLVRVTSGKKTAPEFRAALLCLGDAQFQKGKWAEAERTLADYLAVASESADDALLKFGLCAARQGRPADALARFDGLLSKFPRSELAPHAMFERGQALAALGKAGEARVAFEAVLKSAPNGPLAGAAESQLGTLAVAAGDSAAGAEHFARVAGAAGDKVAAGEAAFQQGQALLAAGEYARAAEVFERGVAEYPGHARRTAAAAQRVVALRRGGKPAEALAAFDLIAKADGEPLEPALRSAVLYERARALQELGRRDEAAEAYRAVIADGAGGLAAYAMVDLAALESEAGREEEAGKLLVQASAAARSEEVPEELRAQAAYRLAASLYKREKYAEAAKTLDPLVDSSGALLGPALRLRGQSRMAMGKPVPAAADFARLVKEFPDDSEAASDLLGLGEALAGAQDWAGSEKALGAYLERFPSGDLWFRARFGLGWAKENQSRLEDAMSDYAAVVAAHQGPTAARAQFQTGECLFALKRYDDAVRELLKVDILYAYPEWSAAALYEAGRCFAQQNRPEDARAQFAMVTEKYGQTDWARLADKELARLKAPAPSSVR